MNRRRRGLDRHLAAAFCENARSFHEMARSQRDRHGGTSASFLAIAIELGLKAYLLHRGITDQWNRDMFAMTLPRRSNALGVLA